ncbi:hypothetical protein F975_00016, partial [Acinetobacter sp. ANC 3789]
HQQQHIDFIMIRITDKLTIDSQVMKFFYFLFYYKLAYILDDSTQHTFTRYLVTH